MSRRHYLRLLACLRYARSAAKRMVLYVNLANSLRWRDKRC